MSLSRAEMEVTINFDAESDMASLYTSFPAWINKMDRLCKERPENFRMVKEDYMMDAGRHRCVAKEYEFPKNLITIRSGRRRTVHMTDEQREQARERMNKIHSERRNMTSMSMNSD